MAKVVGMSNFVGRRCCSTPISVKPAVCRTAPVSRRRCPMVARRIYRTITRATEGGENRDADTNPEPPAPQEASAEKQATPPPPSPAGSEEEEMGIVGQIIAWGFLSILFAASIFFTFSRQFLPDLVPLDINSPPL